MKIPNGFRHECGSQLVLPASSQITCLPPLEYMVLIRTLSFPSKIAESFNMTSLRCALYLKFTAKLACPRPGIGKANGQPNSAITLVAKDNVSVRSKLTKKQRNIKVCALERLSEQS